MILPSPTTVRRNAHGNWYIMFLGAPPWGGSWSCVFAADDADVNREAQEIAFYHEHGQEHPSERRSPMNARLICWTCERPIRAGRTVWIGPRTFCSKRCAAAWSAERP